MTSNRVLMGVLFVLVALALTAAVSAQNGVGTIRHVTFDEAVRIQGQTVPAGSYNIEHVMEGQNHVMVFTGVSKDHQQFRFNCNMVKLTNKAKQTTKVYDTASGNKVLKSMTFAGDTYEHVFGE